MSMKSLEAAILNELRHMVDKRSIRQKDIQEWSTGKIDPHEGETYYYLPRVGVHVCVLTSALPKVARGEATA